MRDTGSQPIDQNNRDVVSAEVHSAIERVRKSYATSIKMELLFRNIEFPEGEDAVEEEQWKQVTDDIDRVLESGSEGELITMAKGKIDRAIAQSKLQDAMMIANTFSLTTEKLQEAVNRVRAEKQQKERERLESEEAGYQKELEAYQKITDPKKKKEFLEKFNEEHNRVLTDGRKRDVEVLKILRGEYLTVFVREKYADPKAAKSREAFEHAVDVLRFDSSIFKTWTPEMQARVHKDAVAKIDGFTRYENAEARRTLQIYLDLGLIDFDQDEELIDRVTSGK